MRRMLEITTLKTISGFYGEHVHGHGLQAAEQKDTTHHQSVAKLELQPQNDRNWERQHHHVGQDIRHCVSDPEGTFVDAIGLDGFIPRPLDRNTLENGGKNRADAPADDHSHDNPASHLESRPYEDSLVQQDDRHFVQAHHNFVRSLGDEKPSQRRSVLLHGEVCGVLSVAMQNSKLYCHRKDDGEDLRWVKSVQRAH